MNCINPLIAMRTMIVLLSIIFLRSQAVQTDDGLVQNVEKWHTERVTGLKKEHGWLSLIALDWLKEGENSIPAIGTISIRKQSVKLVLKKDLAGKLNGNTFTSGPLIPDKDKVVIGSRALQVIERGGKYAVRIWDAESDARKKFSGIDRYPVMERWRITARWEPYSTPKTIEIPTVIPGLIQKGIVPGAAVFIMNGIEYKLEPTAEEGSKELFFVFGDRTNGKETYGAGRFLYAGPPENGTIVLDFNRSYNPPCVFSDYATCPVPTKENRLPVRIEAGEKNYKHH